MDCLRYAGALGASFGPEFGGYRGARMCVLLVASGSRPCNRPLVLGIAKWCPYLKLVVRAMRFLPLPKPNFALADRSTKSFLRRYASGLLPPATGSPDDQANAFTRLPPLVALLAGAARQDLLTAVACMIR